MLPRAGGDDDDGDGTGGGGGGGGGGGEVVGGEGDRDAAPHALAGAGDMQRTLAQTGEPTHGQ